MSDSDQTPDPRAAEEPSATSSEFWGEQAPTTTATEDVPAVRHRSRLIAAGAAAAVLAAAGIGFAVFETRKGGTTTTTSAAAPAVAADRGRRGGGIGGTLQSVDGSTLTLMSRDGTTVRVSTSASTVFHRVVTAALSDLKAGDNVIVTGTPGAGTIAADRIVDNGTVASTARPAGSPGPGGPGGFTAGTVRSVSGTTVTITGRDGTNLEVTTSASTVVSALRTVGLHDLVTGEQVRVEGTAAPDGTVAATSVDQGTGGFGGPGGGRRTRGSTTTVNTP